MRLLVLQSCVVCGKKTATHCSRCKTVFYCGPSHLAEDWPIHQLSCIPVEPEPVAQPYTQNQATACSSSRPTPIRYASQQAPEPYVVPPPRQVPQLSSTYVVPPSHHETPTISFDAIHLGEHEDHPRIVRVRCRPRAPGASLPAVIDLPSVGSPAKCIDVKHVVGGELLFPLQVWYCPTSSGSENRAIQRLTGGTAPRSWKGGVLVMKCDVVHVSHMSYTDATLADIPILAHFLVHHT